MNTQAALPSNVQLDAASAYGWEQLNETAFLTRCFVTLARELPCFSSWRFFVFSSHQPEAVPASAALPGDDKVLIAISDESPSISATLALQAHYRHIFKAYLPRELLGSRVYPFHPGVVGAVPQLAVRPFAERSLDVFFAGNLNPNRLPLYCALHPLLRHLSPALARSLVRRMPRRLRRHSLDRLADPALGRTSLLFSDGFRRGLAPAAYAGLLHDSRIVLCPRGFSSSETFRHMEALRAGAVVVSEPLPDTTFYRGSPIVTVPDWRTGYLVIQQLLADPAALLERHQASLAWWNSHCSEQATARYLAKRLRAEPIDCC
ncbi:hypothetical protein KBY97_03325 [Synechococcus sp. ATX 2A4]|uniref:hypothetical protein n=1 Tax=Synechococcus sp. ATX 2A4 TaxID=2823727 RepID=UPI0020CCB30E|nr:hypothetical protein [Synechococcus sp. ATX 2A4]MCP9884160.1 hypothetical protein [Synechococcus sp. ATX 2A4]